MTENKSSDVFLEKERQADELRRPENSANPFPFAWRNEVNNINIDIRFTFNIIKTCKLQHEKVFYSLLYIWKEREESCMNLKSWFGYRESSRSHGWQPKRELMYISKLKKRGCCSTSSRTTTSSKNHDRQRCIILLVSSRRGYGVDVWETMRGWDFG